VEEGLSIKGKTIMRYGDIKKCNLRQGRRKIKEAMQSRQGEAATRGVHTALIPSKRRQQTGNRRGAQLKGRNQAREESERKSFQKFASA